MILRVGEDDESGEGFCGRVGIDRDGDFVAARVRMFNGCVRLGLREKIDGTVRGNVRKFEDERVGFPQLVEMRSGKGYNAAVPLGQLPTLTLPDGSVHVQSGP